ncbi:MAG TPA: TetR/AcrR family transcriptional regulator [Caulobacteraceae bacterium]|nr:TetR/AcrR family transcriptional regulator [Caulobacteraceae bacterium]
MSVRQAQKQATRRRVLDAARDLFDEIGYEDATIRAIAQRAGVSVGSVFTTFTSKDDILSQVMLDRLEELYGELQRVVPHLRGSTADRCRSLFAVHYAFETRRVRLFLAHVAAAYSWRNGTSTVPYGRNARLRGMLIEGLRAGIERGDVRPDIDPEVVVDCLMAAYAWNYRLAASQGADAEALTGMMDKQIGVIFDGVAPRD